MLTYKAVKQPVLVRSYPGPDSNIVSIIPVGKTFNVISQKENWLRLQNGYYVFKTDNVALSVTEGLPNINPVNPSSFSSDIYRFDPDTDNSSSTTPTHSTDQARTNESEMSAGEISSKYSGALVRITSRSNAVYRTEGEDDRLARDLNGDYEKITTPDLLMGDANATTLLEVTEEGIAVVRDASGQLWFVDASQIQVLTAENADAEEWESIPVSDEMLKERETRSTVSAIKDLIEKIKGGASISSLFTTFTDIYKINVGDVHSIFGYPYQFHPLADPRLAKTSKDDKRNKLTPDVVADMLNMRRLGRKFSQKIAARAPVLVMQAGIPEFLKGYDKSMKERILSTLLDIMPDGEDDVASFDQVLDQAGQYYSFKAKPQDYYTAVNSVCRTFANLLGIGDVSVANLASTNNAMVNGFGMTLETIDWKQTTQHPYLGYYEGAVCFYIHTDAQVHEQFSNSTRQSQLASTVNQISDQAMELQFILGGLGASINETDYMPDFVKNATNRITSFGSEFGSGSESRNYGSGLIQSMVKNISTFLAGGKMVFPEIWSDSQFGRTYNVTIKLISPDADRVSIFLNILVPLAHILGFVLPRQAGDNSYISPFLVRTWYKSMFSIDMGIITSCEVVKGDSGAWSQEGFPTQVTVQLAIKDLYSSMSQALNQGFSTILTNPAQMNYIANLCGMDIGAVSIVKLAALWYMLTVNKITDYPFKKLTDMVRSTIGTFFNINVYRS